MSKVPTINPGPDDSDRMPQDATETLPIISAADTKGKKGRDKTHTHELNPVRL